VNFNFALARDESARNVTVSDPLVEYPFIILANAFIYLAKPRFGAYFV
jgi:hypothetical protein